MENVITTVAQVTPEWLTGALRKSGFLKRGEVINVKNKLTKTRPLSVVSRLEISYSMNVDGPVPRGLFLKIAAPDLSHALPSELKGKEVEFYRTVASKMNDRHLIRCYDAAYSAENGNSHLLLDDLSETHFQTESPQPPSKLYCEMAVECMGQLHAFWWEHPRLGKEMGKLFDEDELNVFVGEVEKNVVSFINFLGDGLSAERRKIYDRLLAAKHKIWGRLTDAAGLTLTHGDAHWWNLLYPREAGRDHVRLFDWQLWHVDVGARDLAFMVSLGGYTERRAAMEQNLIRRYYDSLIVHGVRNYAWEDCWNDYRCSAIRNLNVPVIQWSQGRSVELWSGNLERAMLAYDELGCGELIDS